MKVKGKVKAFSPSVSAGIIETPAGKNYVFYAKEWNAGTTPSENLEVEFEEGHEATNIRVPE